MSKLMTVGARIQTLRKEAKISQSELAKTLGVSRSLIAQIEGDNSNPSLDMLTFMVVIFNTTFDYLIKGEEIQEEVVYKIKDPRSQKVKEDTISYSSHSGNSDLELLREVVAELIAQSKHLREINEFLMRHVENAEELVKDMGEGSDKKKNNQV